MPRAQDQIDLLTLLGLKPRTSALTPEQLALRKRLNRRMGLYLLVLVLLPSLLISLPVFHRAWAIRPLPLAKKDGYVDAAIGLVPERLIWLNPIGSAMALAPEIHGCFPKNPGAMRGGLHWTKTFGGAQLAGAFWFFLGALIETGCVVFPLLFFWQVREERRGGIRRGPQQFIGLVLLPLLFFTLLFVGHYFGWAILRFFIVPIHANQVAQYDFLIVSARSVSGGRDVLSSPPGDRETTVTDATTSETVRILLSEERTLDLDPRDLLWNFTANDRAHLERNVHAVAALYGVDADTMEGIRGRIDEVGRESAPFLGYLYSAVTALLEDTGMHPHGAESLFRNALVEAEASGIPRERILKLREVFLAHEERCFSREHGFRLLIDWAPVSLERARLGDRIVWLCHWRGNERASVALSRQDRLLEKLPDAELTPDDRNFINYTGFRQFDTARASWFFLVIDEETNEVLGSDEALW